jgi:hypothetical protein
MRKFKNSKCLFICSSDSHTHHTQHTATRLAHLPPHVLNETGSPSHCREGCDRQGRAVVLIADEARGPLRSGRVLEVSVTLWVGE